MLNLTAFKDLVHTSRMKIDNFANNGKDKLSRAKAASVWRLYTETYNGDSPIPDYTSVEDIDGKVIEELSLSTRTSYLTRTPPWSSIGWSSLWSIVVKGR